MAKPGKRKDDTPQTRVWVRSERVFQEGDQWYFTTREGTVEGPFRDWTAAVEQLDTYIRLMNSGLAPSADDGSTLALQAH